MLQRYKLLDAKTQRKLTFKRTSPTTIESDCTILDKFKNDLLSENTARDIKGKYFYFLQNIFWHKFEQFCRIFL